MDWFLLQPLSVLALTQALLLFIVTVYLLSLTPKTRGTWLLAFVFGVLSLIWMQLVVSRSLNAVLPFDIGPFGELATPFILYALLHFAYLFVYNPFRRESRIVLTGVGFLVGANAVYQIYRMITFTGISASGALGLEIVNMLIILGSLSVYLRKRARLAKGLDRNRRGSPGPDQAEQLGKESKALRAFALLTAGMMLVSVRGMWMVAMDLWPALGTPSPFIGIVNLPAMVLLIVLFVVVYINHMPEPTTVQAKIIGLSLATLLAVFAIADLMLFSEADLEREGLALLPGHQTLRFEPDGQGGYRVGHIPFRFDPALGDNLGMGLETDSLVSLGFAFPFYGTRWQELYIDSNGLVAFGGPYLTPRFQDFYSDEHPKIAPFYRALLPNTTGQSGVFYKREADKVTITWFLVWEGYSSVPTNRNTIQLVLYEHGAIDFVYDRVEAPFDGRIVNGLRGLHPGGARPPLEKARFVALRPEVITAAALPWERAVRFEPHDDGEYRLTLIPFDLDPDLGDDLQLSDDTNARVKLDFSFPFYETSWEEAHVSANGVVAFGSPINPPDSMFFRPLRDFYTDVPKIAPFFVDLNPAQGGGVFYKREADKATITWHQVPLLGTGSINTVQLVLYEQGAVDFFYDRVWVPLYRTDLWGLYPGDDRPRSDVAHYLFDLRADPAPAGAMLVEDFGLMYRRFVHAKVLPLAVLVLASTLFILVIFPLFFRTSLIKPLQALLQGVRRVNEGDHDAQVPVRVNDEIGTLTRSFNEMTASLKTAEDQLRAYAEGLEEKVAERTQDLQQALHHLTEAQDQLILAEKMASLGQLTAGIAHEIKNPLNFVNNFAQLSIELADELEEEIAAHEDKPVAEIREELAEILGHLKQNAAKIREHGKRADGIVQSMLEHSRGGEGERRAVVVNAFVNEYVNLAYHGMRANTPDFNVMIERDFDETVGKVEMAPQEIGRVFINLLNNAFYAVHQKAAALDGAYAPTVAVSTRRTGEMVEIRLRDNGPGIAETLRQKIFEPFYTTKPTGEGTGLGLSLSYDIVTQGHGGTLAVESEEGEGATFIIALPKSPSRSFKQSSVQGSSEIRPV